jgi:peptidoglycan/xylan/chitin deacetylase (PgdA/CDA1 family)
MRILMFHDVGGDDYPEAAFAATLEWLARSFRVVPLALVVESVANGRRIAEVGVSLTFDDGLRNHVTVVYPLLRRMGLPATFFVCPELIEKEAWLWNHEARERLRPVDARGRSELARCLGAPNADVEGIVTHMKTLEAGARSEAQESIRALTPDFAPSEPQHRMFDVMSWDELASLDPTLVTVGSHTLTHPILTTLDNVSLDRELGESRHRLEARLGRCVDVFCYPNGSTDSRVRSRVQAHYRAAVTTAPGLVDAGADPFQLNRIRSDPRLSYLAWRMHRPGA